MKSIGKCPSQLTAIKGRKPRFRKPATIAGSSQWIASFHVGKTVPETIFLLTWLKLQMGNSLSLIIYLLHPKVTGKILHFNDLLRNLAHFALHNIVPDAQPISKVQTRPLVMDRWSFAGPPGWPIPPDRLRPRCYRLPCGKCPVPAQRYRNR